MRDTQIVLVYVSDKDNIVIDDSMSKLYNNASVSLDSGSYYRADKKHYFRSIVIETPDVGMHRAITDIKKNVRPQDGVKILYGVTAGNVRGTNDRKGIYFPETDGLKTVFA